MAKVDRLSRSPLDFTTLIDRSRSLPDPVVEKILARRAEGETFTAIANALNDRQVPTAQGGKAWYPATVRTVETAYGVATSGV